MATHTQQVQQNNSKKPNQLTIQYRRIDSLGTNPKNPRCHSDRQLRQIARSIQTFGYLVPVLVTSDLQVIAGHGRLLASKLLGIEEVPTISVDHLSDLQCKAFTIADNRLTEIATWNEQLLGEQLKMLSEAELDFSIDATGFEVPEIDVFIEGLSSANDDGVDPADELPSLEEHPISRIGDLWALGSHRVLCGNALSPESYNALMGAARASVVFSDPPYNVRIDGHATGNGKVRHREFAMACGELSAEEFTRFLTDALSLAATHSSRGSLHYVCIDWRHVGELLDAGTSAYSELKNICVWVKDIPGMGSLYRSQHEFVLVFKNGNAPHRNNVQLGKFGRSRSNVWNYPGANSFSRSSPEGDLLSIHPTVKPVGLVADAIMDCSAPREIVLDPFLGSGTTIVAAERTGRIAYGIELDPLYVDVVVRRWQKFTGKLATHSATNRSFDEIAEARAHEEL